MALVETMRACRTPRLAGLSIDGNEALAGRTGERFRPAFLAAKAAGFGCTVHAGESSGPEGVRDALDLLRADRLDHGVRAAEDPALVGRLVRERCDFLVSIPMRGKVNSLNASNAAAVLLYEAVRRRTCGVKGDRTE